MLAIGDLERGLCTVNIIVSIYDDSIPLMRCEHCNRLVLHMILLEVSNAKVILIIYLMPINTIVSRLIFRMFVDLYCEMWWKWH